MKWNTLRGVIATLIASTLVIFGGGSTTAFAGGAGNGASYSSNDSSDGSSDDKPVGSKKCSSQEHDDGVGHCVPNVKPKPTCSSDEDYDSASNSCKPKPKTPPKCDYGVDSDGKTCKSKPEAPKPQKCDYGSNADGSCKQKPVTCQYGNDASGACKPKPVEPPMSPKPTCKADEDYVATSNQCAPKPVVCTSPKVKNAQGQCVTPTTPMPPSGGASDPQPQGPGKVVNAPNGSAVAAPVANATASGAVNQTVTGPTGSVVVGDGALSPQVMTIINIPPNSNPSMVTPQAVGDPQPVSAAASASASTGDQSTVINIAGTAPGGGTSPAVTTNNTTNTSYRNLTFTPMPVAALPPVQVGGSVQVIDAGVCGPRRYMLETFDPESREAVLFGGWRNAVSYKTLLGKVGPYRAGEPGKQKAPDFTLLGGRAKEFSDRDDDLSFIVTEVKIPDPKNPTGDPLYARIDYIGHQVTTLAVIHTNGGGSGVTLNLVGSEGAKAGGISGNSANGVPQIGQVVRECVFASYEGKPTPKEVPPKVVTTERLVPQTAIKSICDFGDEIDAAECNPPSAGPVPVKDRPLIIAKPDMTKPGNREYRVLKDPKFCDKNPDACVTVKARPGSTEKGAVLKMNCNDPKDTHMHSCVEQYGHDDLKGLPWYLKWLDANPQFKPKPTAQ